MPTSTREPISPAEFVAGLTKRMRDAEEEHSRRMATDAEYRAEYERRAAEECARAEAEKRERERQLRADIARRRRDKGIPEKFWPYLDAWREGSVVDLAPTIATAHRWVERFLRREPAGWVFLFLAGNAGTGKTSAAAWFLDAPRVTTEPADPWSGETRTVVREAPGLFVTAEALSKASTFAGEFWDKVRDAPRLVIDDLGVEQHDGKGWALGNLTTLLSHRHAHELPTVLTMNLTREAFAERYASHDGGRLRDRLREAAWFQPIEGPSQRKALSLRTESAESLAPANSPNR